MNYEALSINHDTTAESLCSHSLKRSFPDMAIQGLKHGLVQIPLAVHRGHCTARPCDVGLDAVLVHLLSRGREHRIAVVESKVRLLGPFRNHHDRREAERLWPRHAADLDDRAGLEDIEMTVYDLWNQADGYYFISRNVPNTNQSERSELIFYTMSFGSKRPLHIFQLARTTMY